MRPSIFIELAIATLFISYVYITLIGNLDFSSKDYSSYLIEDIYISLISLEQSNVRPQEICYYLKRTFPQLEFLVYDETNTYCITGVGLSNYSFYFIYYFNNTIYNLTVLYSAR